jgi:uncharacterized protein
MSPHIKEIKKHCLLFYSSLDFAHGPEHGERVVEFAMGLQKREGGDPFLVEAGAWLHQFHDHPDELSGLLDKIDLNDGQRGQLQEIVRLCRPHLISSKASVEAQVVFDADALDLMGPTGVFREVLCNAVARKQSPQEAIARTREVQELFRTKLQTQTARQIAAGEKDSCLAFWNDFDLWSKPSQLF